MKFLRSLFFLILFIIKYYPYFFNGYLEVQPFFRYLKNIRWWWQFSHYKNITMKYEYCSNITFIMFWTDIARFLQNFRNLSNSFINILEILQDFNGIFLKYFLNITVLCGFLPHIWLRFQTSNTKIVQRPCTYCTQLCTRIHCSSDSTSI